MKRTSNPRPAKFVAKVDYELAQAIAFLKSRSAMRASAN